MAYQVIKTIKGRKYLYQQESYREGNKVRTRCICLGAIDPVTGELYEGNKIQRTVSKTTSDVIEITAPLEINTTNENPTISLQKHSEQLLYLKANIEKKHLTRTGFLLAHKAMLSRLRTQGVDLDSIPQVIVKDSPIGNWKYQREKNRVVVSIAHSNHHRAQIRREVFRGYGRVIIETMRQQKPDEFAKLTLQLEKSFLRSQRLISRFVMLGRDRNKIAKTLSLRFWGNVLQLDQNILDPERLGLVDKSKRKSWEDEAASIYGAIAQQGPELFIKERKKHYAKAKAAYQAAAHKLEQTPRFSPGRPQARRNFERSQFRLAAQKELMTKIRLMEKLFFGTNSFKTFGTKF